jgi:hypothetical protein
LHKDLLSLLNSTIFEQYGVEKIIAQAKANQFYLDKNKVAELDAQTYQKILETLKITLKQVPGIHDVWTSEELRTASFEPWQLESYFKTQHYPGRSGDIICMVKPYSMISKRTCGTTHSSPYKDTTHVPLIFYQAGNIEKKVIDTKVFIPQVPVTIAKILGVQPPSASPFQELPGILLQPCE